MTPRLSSVVPACLFLAPFAAGQTTTLDIESGSVYQSKNKVAIPADSTKFSYRQLLGKGPFAYQRFTVTFNPDAKEGYRFVYAPLSLSGTGQLDKSVNFDGTTFDPNTPTEGRYTFNNYRFTWWRKWRPIGDAQVRAGWTLFIRDARVSLSQTGKSETFYNLGPVPLFYLKAEKPLAKNLASEFEFDGLLSPNGGALDFGLALKYQADPQKSLKLQLRYLDGGTGRGSAYNFASLAYVAAVVQLRW